MAMPNHHKTRQQAQQRTGLVLPVVLVVASVSWLASPVWTGPGFAFETNVGAQNQQNVLAQTATTQGVGQTSVPGGSGFVGPR